MNQLQKYFSTTEEHNYVLIFISFIFCILTSFIIKFVYEKKSISISSKQQISTIIPLMSMLIFLIILIVKSSLALSLGLIGALSIVRFRTPIKEPEELIYLFFSIGIGIGYGSGQIIVTTFIFLSIIFIIWFFLPYEKINKDLNYNLLIEYQINDIELSQEEIINTIKKTFKNSHIIKIETNENRYELMARVTLDDIKQIDKIKILFKNKASISFSESNVFF
jgi:uncharacterized membrane protein YhiD involved in acid resistance